jgi:uncharacterized repeat protein (TIGR03803 family)
MCGWNLRRLFLFCLAGLAVAKLCGSAFAQVPVVTTVAATSVSSNSATLNADVNPEGHAAGYWFQYGTTTSYGSVTATNSAGSGTSQVNVNIAINNLAQGTKYNFRVAATNSSGTSFGGNLTFTTTAHAPVVTTGTATSITMTGATLQGTANPNGASAAAWFEYGTTTNYGKFSTTNALGTGTNGVPVSINIAGLSPQTTYHFQLVSTNIAGQKFGGDAVFTTQSAQPTVTTLSAINDNGAQATLQGTVVGNGITTGAWFRYGTSTNYGLTSSVIMIGVTNAGAVPVSALVNVSYHTVYHFQLVATNSSGTGFGADQTFTTPNAPIFGALTDLHNFNGYTGDDFGALPQASVIASGNTLYGTTIAGGSDQNGVVFRMNNDGTGYTVLHTFAGVDDFAADGSGPTAALLLYSNVLYGTTANGGIDGFGTVFSLNTDGSGYTKLYDFTASNDGANPNTTLVVSGNTLYGTCATGGLNGTGTIFSIHTDGSDFTPIYEFSAADPNTGDNGDGVNPQGNLVLTGGTLFGVAEVGGESDNGTVYQVNTDGTGFITLHAFDFTDGSEPLGGVTLSGTVLYGTASFGGDFTWGTVFSLDTNTLEFTTLYNFTGGSDGAGPEAGVAYNNGELYGATAIGGTNNSGAVYALSADGSVFDPIYSFSNFSEDDPTNSDGFLPLATPVLIGTNLYGTAFGGGPIASGTVFEVSPNGKFTVLADFDSPTNNSDGRAAGGNLALSGNTLYSTTQFGGVFDSGTIFKVNTDGSGFETLHDFTLTDPTDGTNSDGAQPVAGLILGGSELYGTASIGGTGASGVVYSVDTNGDNFTVLYDFSSTNSAGINNDGQEPDAGLILSGKMLYGTTSLGGQGGTGTIYSLSTDGSVPFQALYSFTPLNSGGFNSDGANPNTRLLLSGTVLYGTTLDGGNDGAGTIFSLDTSDTNYTVLYTFAGVPDGAFSQGGLVLSGNTLYGTVSGGGAFNNGAIFSINTDGSGYQILYSFSAATGPDGTNSDGTLPICDLLLSGNVLYGTADFGGPSGEGTIFQINTDGSDFTTLLNFSFDTVGANPEAGLLESGQYLYGTTSAGSLLEEGNVFGVDLSRVPVQLFIQPSGTNIVLTWSDPYYALQVSTNVQGTYSNIVGSTSPYTTNTAGAQQFYRLSSAP